PRRRQGSGIVGDVLRGGSPSRWRPIPGTNLSIPRWPASTRSGVTMQLQGKVALITGAGSGIGQAAAVLLGADGAKIAAVSRTEAELRETVEQVRERGGEGAVFTADVSDDEQIQAATEAVVRKWG